MSFNMVAITLLLLDLQLHATTLSADLVVDIEQFGARADNATLNTASIAAAIKATAAAGGGTVRFAALGGYRTGRIELASHVHLWIGPGASIQGSPRAADWTPYSYRGCVNATRRDFGGPLLYGQQIQNFSVSGGGTVRSSGPVWWPLHKNTSRGSLLMLVRCEDGNVSDLTFTMSSGCNILPMFSQRLRFDNLTVLNPWFSPNTDGWDPWGSSHLSFTNSFVETGDGARSQHWVQNAACPCRTFCVSDPAPLVFRLCCDQEWECPVAAKFLGGRTRGLHGIHGHLGRECNVRRLARPHDWQ